MKKILSLVLFFSGVGLKAQTDSIPLDKLISVTVTLLDKRNGQPFKNIKVEIEVKQVSEAHQKIINNYLAETDSLGVCYIFIDEPNRWLCLNGVRGAKKREEFVKMISTKRITVRASKRKANAQLFVERDLGSTDVKKWDYSMEIHL